jgi:2-polyprenyl-3-methyl-5-hydroxy-6-metoxy-1,4-benzoquinol methylase
LQPLSEMRILDIGCGPGLLAKALAFRGAHATGVDPFEHAIASAREAAQRTMH